MDISSGKFLIVSSFQNKSNCGRFKIVISLFSIRKYLFDAKTSFFKQSQERDRWLHFFRCSTESSGTKTEALLRVVLGVVAFLALGLNFWDGRFKIVHKVLPKWRQTWNFDFYLIKPAQNSDQVFLLSAMNDLLAKCECFKVPYLYI